MSDSLDLTGLDQAFLRYTGVNPVDQRRNQSFYLQFFKDCHRVANLGCGDGDFVQLLLEQGVQAVGVDNDPVAAGHLRQKGIPTVSADAVSYLEAVEPATLDGIFAAHLVEHLPYQAVYQLIVEAHRVLRPGGRIVLVTPNPRGLISHLEMYWLHFGHVSFYHPRLLCFFLHYAGFGAETWGENPAPAYPIFGDLAEHRIQGDVSTVASARVGSPPLAFDPGQPYPVTAPAPSVHWSASVPRGNLARWRNYLRVRLARLLGLDDAIRQANTEFSRLSGQLAVLSGQLAVLSADMATLIERVDRPFECYATATKLP